MLSFIVALELGKVPFVLMEPLRAFMGAEYFIIRYSEGLANSFQFSFTTLLSVMEILMYPQI